ncbi:MAG: hypothetical protein DME33_05310 [Verrucomicrobia bacterium]|nr:MAG: hypothetical protein DME33_05310 [Verrucomicrobiota bacterium]
MLGIVVFPFFSSNGSLGNPKLHSFLGGYSGNRPNVNVCHHQISGNAADNLSGTMAAGNDKSVPFVQSF